MNKLLYLASTSVYRKALLEKLTTHFYTAKPAVDETPMDGESPVELVQRLALAKALDVAQSLSAQNIDAVVIGSDQVATHAGLILGKPHTKENAFTQLRSFSGNAVTFLTGVAVVDTTSPQQQVLSVPFTVHFRNLTDAEILRYIDREQPLHCAGSFKSEGLGITLFQALEGDDPNTLIGLPLIKLHQMLKNVGMDLLLDGQ